MVTHIDGVLTLHILLCAVSWLLLEANTESYNYNVIDVKSSSLSTVGGQPLAGRIDFQLAAVDRHSGQLFVAASDRLLQFNSELNLLHSASVQPECRQNKRYRQLVTSCSLHNDANLLALLPTNAVNTDTG